MNLSSISFKVILTFGIVIAFSACNGQVASESTEITEKTSMLGRRVSELDGKILLVFQDSQNNYWFGGNDKGAFKYNGDSLVLYTLNDGLCGTNVMDIQEDKYGMLYFDTPKGVSKFDGETFSTLAFFKGDSTKNEWKSTEDDIWFRVGGDSPYRYDGTYLYHLAFPITEITKEFHSKYPNASYSPSSIYSTYKDSKGNIWFGTSSIGFFRYDGESLQWLYEEQLQTTPSGGDFGMRSILEDKDGLFWFNNMRYRYAFLDDSKTDRLNYRREKGVVNSADGDKVPYFLSMVEDDNGDIWGVTYDDGVWKNNGEELIHYPIKNGDRDILLFSIYKDRKGKLWLGTHHDGVYVFKGEIFEKFEPKH